MGNCSSGCPTPGEHTTWGECMRAKNTRVGWAASVSGRDLTKEKRWQSRIKEARAARAQGIKPDSTRLSDVRRAVDISNRTGRPYVSDR